MDFNSGRFIDPHDPIAVEVGLHDAPLCDIDRVVERGTGAENDAALNLRLRAVGIDDPAAIDCAKPRGRAALRPGR